MNRIGNTFKTLANQSRKALISFVTAGDPDLQQTLELMRTLVSAGTDIIELGVPFSDPMAEGPVIQAACERALEHRINLPDIFSIVAAFRKTDQKTPIILMGYLNPIEAMGYAEFTAQAEAAGVDGVLTVDLPPEEAGDYCAQAKKRYLDTIFLIAPTSTADRIKKICQYSSGFVYYVSMKGVTGASHLDVDSVSVKVSEIKKNTSLPVGVGFGIKDAESASAIADFADAVIVGSAIVKRVADNLTNPDLMNKAVADLIKEIRQSIDLQCERSVNTK